MNGVCLPRSFSAERGRPPRPLSGRAFVEPVDAAASRPLPNRRLPTSHVREPERQCRPASSPPRRSLFPRHCAQAQACSWRWPRRRSPGSSRLGFCVADPRAEAVTAVEARDARDPVARRHPPTSVLAVETTSDDSWARPPTRPPSERSWRCRRLSRRRPRRREHRRVLVLKRWAAYVQISGHYLGYAEP